LTRLYLYSRVVARLGVLAGPARVPGDDLFVTAVLAGS
jgi:hypothetical protein